MHEPTVHAHRGRGSRHQEARMRAGMRAPGSVLAGKEHRVAEGEEPVVVDLGHRIEVTPARPGKGLHEQQQRRAREVEVRHQQIDDAEAVRAVSL